MEYPVLKIESSTYHELPINTTVLGKEQLEYYTWIHLPHDLSRDFALVQIDNIDDSLPKEVKRAFINRKPGKPWIRIRTGALNQSIGLHRYKITLVNKTSDDVVSLYFAYIMQDNNPDKPYIYMRKEGKDESNFCK